MSTEGEDLPIKHGDSCGAAAPRHVTHHGPSVGAGVVRLNRAEGGDAVIAAADVQLAVQGRRTQRAVTQTLTVTINVR